MSSIAKFDLFEQQFIEIIAELQTITVSEGRLREALRTEATKTEAAERARDAALRDASEARNSATAATSGTTQAATALAKANDEIVSLKMKLELVERQRLLLEERCSEMSNNIASLEKEVQQLRPLQSVFSTLQFQYTELQERIRTVTEEARSEASRLENEFRRVEKCASGGVEIRERARLAAAAHAREKHIVSTELQHTTRELLAANEEISRLKAMIAELQLRLSENSNNKIKVAVNHDAETLSEIRAVLEAERAGTAKLERALATALANNADLAAKLNADDNKAVLEKPQSLSPKPKRSINISPIDDFLAE